MTRWGFSPGRDKAYFAFAKDEFLIKPKVPSPDNRRQSEAAKLCEIWQPFTNYENQQQTSRKSHFASVTRRHKSKMEIFNELKLHVDSSANCCVPNSINLNAATHLASMSGRPNG